MIMTFDEAVEQVLKHEGGYVNDPDDAGGETNYGISKRAYPDLDIANLTIEDAKNIYEKDYWEKAKCHLLPFELRYIHFDTAVNMGISRANKILQESIGGVGVDGIIGPQTLRGVNNTNIYKYAFYRLRYYCMIVARNKSQAKFIKGWANRVTDIIQ